MIGALVFLKSLSDGVKKRDFLFLAGGGGERILPSKLSL